MSTNTSTKNTIENETINRLIYDIGNIKNEEIKVVCRIALRFIIQDIAIDRAFNPDKKLNQLQNLVDRELSLEKD